MARRRKSLAEIQKAEAANTKPQHPAPWRWSGYNRERHYLIDGALNNVLFSRDKIEVASPRALALIATAPEMEALLRLFVVGASCCPGVNLADNNPQHDVDCPAIALLARIDDDRTANHSGRRGQPAQHGATGEVMRLRGSITARMQPVVGTAYSTGTDDPGRITLTLGCGHTVSAAREWWFQQYSNALIECRRRHSKPSTQRPDR